ncbi:MAG: ABC transporter substrate-binding protein [Methanophagales archaeon]|nr:ABC transporter substrate-binding protein [Methanophagales archaeon]
MKKVLSYLLVMVILVSCVPLAIIPASAQDSVPSTPEEIEEVARAVLANEIVLYLRAEYLGEDVEHLSLEELRGSASYYPLYPRQITDSADRTVTIYKPIERIVCTISHHVETLRSIKVQKSIIVGLSDSTIAYTSYFPEFSEVECIGGTWEPDVEKILDTHPDVVIIHHGPGPYGSLMGTVQQLEATGMTVLCFKCNDPRIYSEEIAELGYIFEKENEAEEFIDFYESFLNPIVGKTMGIQDKPKVYSEWMMGSPYQQWQISSLDNYPIEIAGGENIYAGAPPAGGTADPEIVAFENPDIIIRIVGCDADATVAGDIANLKAARDEIMGREILKNVTAVKPGNESVYVITSPFWTYLPYSGCRHFIGIGYLAKWFHPQLFSELDPKAVHQEYLTRFQELDINLDEQGVFVYPPL